VKWPQLLKEVAPNLRRIAVLWNPGNPVVANEVERIRQVAPKLGLEIAAFSVSPSNISGSLEAITAAGVDGLIVTDDATFEPIAGRVAAFAAKRGLPAIWGLKLAPELGALMSYKSNTFGLGQRAAHYADHIFKGASPSDLPVEQTTDFILQINLKAAKALGLTIPASLLAIADEVIE
jgi:putative ABC transport system substrate-binding protein